MAKVRFSHLDDFVLKDDGNVGIGTSLPTAKVEVIGNVRAANIKSTAGVSTFISLDGFTNQNLETNDNLAVESGDSGTLSGEIIIGTGTTLSVSTGATTGQGRINSLKVSSTFTPPIGDTSERPSAPQPGALYYNKDFKTIEYWDGNFWRQVDNTTKRGRAVFMGGYVVPANVPDIDFVEMASKGNAVYFGDISALRRSEHDKGASNNIRGMQAGGYVGPNVSDVIDFITFASAGNATDFGNMSNTGYSWSCVSSSTRGIWSGGYQPSNSSGGTNILQRIEIMTLGDAQDFGDLLGKRRSHGANMSPTRGLWAGGHDTGGVGLRESIEYLTISHTGNTADFGDLSVKRDHCPGASNTTRALFGGGRNPANVKTIDYVTMSSTGNAIDFGEQVKTGARPSGTSSQTRGIWAGDNGGGNIIEYVEIATTGNAMDFGDLSRARYYISGRSDSHGGLGGF